MIIKLRFDQTLPYSVKIAHPLNNVAPLCNCDNCINYTILTVRMTYGTPPNQIE